MNREERLRRELPGDLKGRAAELAGLPAGQVDLIIAVVRLSRREGRAIEAQARKRKREGRGGPSAEAVGRLAAGVARHPSLDTLAALAAHYEDAPAVLQMAVDGLRATRPSPCTWAQIGDALGITRQSAWERFGRQAGPDSGMAETGTPDPDEGAA
jgi:hypothetical protein